MRKNARPAMKDIHTRAIFRFFGARRAYSGDLYFSLAPSGATFIIKGFILIATSLQNK